METKTSQVLPVSRKKRILQTLDRIAHCLLLEENSLNAVDISYGTSGVAVFFTLYGQLPGKERYLEHVGSFISNAVEQLNNGYASDDTTNELIDFGLFLQFLHDNEFVETGINDILDQVDEIANANMEVQIGKGNLSHITGALAVGYYYLTRLHDNPKVIPKLEKLLMQIDALKMRDEKDERNIFWMFKLYNDGMVYTGIPHGISDFIIFFYQLYRLNIQQEKCLGLIKGAVSYILSHKYTDHKQTHCYFPNIIGEKKIMTRLSLYYGDLGIGYALLKASAILGDENLKIEALHILTLCARRTTYETTAVEYAALIFGSSGNALLFDKLYQDTGLEVFTKAADIWIDKTLGYARYDSHYAGYNQYYHQRAAETVKPANIGFGEGIAGIGSVLCNYILNKPLPIERLLGIY